MCLAVPAQVREKKGLNMATVDILGVSRTISLDLVGEVETGDWLLIHAGFAIEKVDEKYAHETIEFIKTVPYLCEDTNIFGDVPQPVNDEVLDRMIPKDLNPHEVLAKDKNEVQSASENS